MPRQTVQGYIAYPAIIPYPFIKFLGFALKWSIILLCAASIPFSLYRCFGVIEQVVKAPKPGHIVLQHRRHTPSISKGPRF